MQASDILTIAGLLLTGLLALGAIVCWAVRYQFNSLKEGLAADDRKRREDVRSLHEKLDSLEKRNQARMDTHNAENRAFREGILQRLSHIEALTNGKEA